MTNRAKQWKSNRQIYTDVTFPSGAMADLVKPQMTALITEEGSVPDALIDAMFGSQAQDEQAMMEELKAQGLGMRDFLKTTLYLSKQAARAAFVSPKIVDEPDYDNDEISIDDLTEDDLGFVWNWVQDGGEPAEALKRFRAAQQGRSVSASSQMPGVLPVASNGNGD